METQDGAKGSDGWAQLRFSVVGPLLASPPPPGQLARELERLAAKSWRHPISGEPIRFGASTIERWYYQARAAGRDPVRALRRRARACAGKGASLAEKVKRALAEQYNQHSHWSYQLHYDNLKAQVAAGTLEGPVGSYATVRRYMKSAGLIRRRRRLRPGELQELPAPEREVRSYEVEHVGGLWHLDFHYGSHKLLRPDGQWARPIVLGILDDHSRLACHVQWYFDETAETLVHGLCQALLKRGMPRALLTDNGAAMLAGEVAEGLLRLGIVHATTLPYCAFQNGKQECFWARLEGRLVAMLEAASDLDLSMLNRATQAWVELEYNRTVHRETGQRPIDRFVQGPDVSRTSPSVEELRQAFTIQRCRTQRRSDGTLQVEGRRFEVACALRHFKQLTVRYARWDLSHVYLIDERTDQIVTRLYPLDRAAHADGRRRPLDAPVDAAAAAPCPTPAPGGVAPLLAQLLGQMEASGLPPAYLPRGQEHAELSRPPASQSQEEPS